MEAIKAKTRKGVIGFGNFFLATKARFKGCKRPKRDPDYISYGRYEEISSEYWYGTNKKGSYIIRDSGHWSSSNQKFDVIECGKIASCYWWLVTNKKNTRCGKAYLNAFRYN